MLSLPRFTLNAMMIHLIAIAAVGVLGPQAATMPGSAFKPAISLLGKPKAQLDRVLGSPKKSTEAPPSGFVQFTYKVKGFTSVDVLYRKNLASSVWVRLALADPELYWKEVVSGMGFNAKPDTMFKITSATSGNHRRSVEGIQNLPKNWVLRIYTAGLAREAHEELTAEYAQKWPNMPAPALSLPKSTTVLIYDRTVNLP